MHAHPKSSRRNRLGLTQALPLWQKALALALQALTGESESKSFGGPLKQLRIELAFEAFQRVAERRLRDVELGGGGSQREMPGDGEEIGDVLG